MVNEYKFFSKGLLKEANDAAHREKRSRCIALGTIDNLSINFIFYVIRMFYHRKNEVRVQILVDETGKTELLDISTKHPPHSNCETRWKS